MFKMVFNGYLRSIYVDIKCEISIIRYYSSLDIEMKKFNDRKEYKRALDLFYEYEQKDIRMISNPAINQALKSSTNIKDFQGGSDIYNRYSSRIDKNSFILASLIHFYS
jgi:hypothetical protein